MIVLLVLCCMCMALTASQGSLDAGDCPIASPLQSSRVPRSAHSLIAPFDISKLFKKKNAKSKAEPSASSLQGVALLQGAVPPEVLGTSSTVGTTTLSSVRIKAQSSTSVETSSQPSVVTPTTEVNEAPITVREVKSTVAALAKKVPDKHLTIDGTTESTIRNIMSIVNATSLPTANTSTFNSFNTFINIVTNTDHPITIDEVIADDTTSYAKETTGDENVAVNLEDIDDDVRSESAAPKVKAMPIGDEVEVEAKLDAEPGRWMWPVKRSVVIDGDIILGGLMMVHSRSERWRCGRVMAEGGVQALEAMLFARDAAQAALPDGVRLGLRVLDDCDSDAYGLEMALDFIKGSIGNIEDAEYSCVGGGGRVVSGVVGAASSVTSVQVANLLRLFKIPQISYFSTSPELSNKARFEYFTRTIPSDLHQVRALVDIVRRLGWKYVSVVYEESNYGIKAFEELETLLARADICIAVKERLPKDSGVAEDAAYDAIVAHLLAKPRARGVIVFGSDQEVAGAMAAARRAGAAAWFSWIGSDGWSARALVADGREDVVEGTVSVQPRALPVRGFREYFLNLTVENNRRNPWFVEYWEQQFRCRYPGSPRTPYNGYSRMCSGHERLPSSLRIERQLQFVADAVFAFAYAVRDMHRDICGGRPGLCDAMRPAPGPVLLRYLRRVKFTGLSGDEFQFDTHGDGPARYDVLHYRQVERGRWGWRTVGAYDDGALSLDMDQIRFKLDSPEMPESVCSTGCLAGQARQHVAGERCCWRCHNCSRWEVARAGACAACPPGAVPDAARTRCRRLPERRVSLSSPPALAAAALAGAGLLATAAVAVLWLVRGDTAVVRASGRELSLVLLGGLALCYLAALLLLAPPSAPVCQLQRFGTGFCFTVVYAALLTKTNRIARIFAASRRSARRPAFISPRSQLALCSLLASVQVAVLGVWGVAAPARAVLHYPEVSAGGPGERAAWRVCEAALDARHALAALYPALLVAVCTLYAVLTRKIPEAYNESKHIGFTMYTTCVLWLAFVPLYFGTAAHVAMRIISLAVTISLSATVTLVCLFAPKVYIIVVRPERNVRASLMPARWARGAGRVAASAALLGAPPLALAPAGPAPPAPLADPTPSTDRSTLLDHNEKSTFDRQIQTEDLPLYPRLILNTCDPAEDLKKEELTLDASRLSSQDGTLPAFGPARARGATLSTPL